MPLQDLTPQLRTRLNRMERAVGWFVLLATVLLLFGFGYYIYKTAESRGWFKNRAKFFIFTDDAKGLGVGNQVEFRGSPAGTIIDIKPMPARGPGSEYNVYVEFEILDPNIGYMWTEGSKAKVAAADFLGKRVIEVSRGTAGYATYINAPVRQVSLQELRDSSHPDEFRLGEEVLKGTNLEFRAWESLSPTNTKNVLKGLEGLGKKEIWVIDTTERGSKLVSIWNEKEHHYEPLTKTTKPYHLETDEDPAIGDRIQAVLTQIEAALPNFLALTNQLATVLSNTTRMTSNAAVLTSNLNDVAMNFRPAASNLSLITANLRDPKGSFGEWLIPTNLNLQLASTLHSADGTLNTLDTNLITLNLTLDHLAGITSNLNQQVQANSNILSNISSIVVHSDEFIQGLKHFWLFRGTFKTPKTNAPAASPPPPGQQLSSPRSRGGESPR